jgi:predicted transcriptional regulator
MNAESLVYPRSRFQVLRVLHQAGAPVSLAAIADRAGLVIGSVQQAVKWLLEEKIISLQRDGNRTCYKIIDKSAGEIVAKIADVLEAIEITERSKQYQARAKGLLGDIDQRRAMIFHARSSMKK